MSSFEANIEIDPATNPIVVAFRILEERVKELSQELPGVTFGYIGNLERWGDPSPPRSCRRLRRPNQHWHDGEASSRRRQVGRDR
jgi:hypothetical protein